MSETRMVRTVGELRRMVECFDDDAPLLPELWVTFTLSVEHGGRVEINPVDEVEMHYKDCGVAGGFPHPASACRGGSA